MTAAEGSMLDGAASASGRFVACLGEHTAEVLAGLDERKSK
jgi:hypothetical protein